MREVEDRRNEIVGNAIGDRQGNPRCSEGLAARQCARKQDMFRRGPLECGLVLQEKIERAVDCTDREAGADRPAHVIGMPRRIGQDCALAVRFHYGAAARQAVGLESGQADRQSPVGKGICMLQGLEGFAEPAGAGERGGSQSDRFAGRDVFDKKPG